MQKKVEISKLFWPKVMHFLSDAQYFLYKKNEDPIRLLSVGKFKFKL